MAFTNAKVALHPEGVDRNKTSQAELTLWKASPSTRRAWIEMLKICVLISYNLVALHPEGVDRNQYSQWVWMPVTVALHPEGVDRNTSAKNPLSTLPKVALHPEGVDRNYSREATRQGGRRRPPPGGRG